MAQSELAKATAGALETLLRRAEPPFRNGCGDYALECESRRDVVAAVAVLRIVQEADEPALMAPLVRLARAINRIGT